MSTPAKRKPHCAIMLLEMLQSHFFRIDTWMGRDRFIPYPTCEITHLMNLQRFVSLCYSTHCVCGISKLGQVEKLAAITCRQLSSSHRCLLGSIIGAKGGFPLLGAGVLLVRANEDVVDEPLAVPVPAERCDVIESAHVVAKHETGYVCDD